MLADTCSWIEWMTVSTLAESCGPHLASEQAKVVPLDASLALLAADVGREHGLAIADAIIHATAWQYGATVVTSDKHFEALPQVLFYPKTE